MTKRKTKLVCVGWGVYWLLPPTGISFKSCKLTRKLAIREFNKHHDDPDYKGYRRKGLAIAKQLWLEVKDD